MNAVLPGSLTNTRPATGATLTFLATTGGGGIRTPSKSFDEPGVTEDGFAIGVVTGPLPVPQPPLVAAPLVPQVTTFDACASPASTAPLPFVSAQMSSVSVPVFDP